MRSRAAQAVPITLSEEGGVRYLHFGSPWVQGAMRIARPDELVLEYIEQMMGWLLFVEPPKRILQLGLGAGSLARWCLRHLPDSGVTAVEISDEVIATVAQWFALPRDEPGLRIVRADAQDFVERTAERGRYGVVQVDLYDMFAYGPAIDSARFYRGCRDALAEPGVCVVNLFGRHASFAPNLARIARAFDGRVLALPQIAAGNQTVFAFRGPPLRVAWERLEARGRTLRRRYRLAADEWVAALRAARAGRELAV